MTIDTQKLRDRDLHKQRSLNEDFDLLCKCADHIDAQTNEIAEYAALCQRQSDLLSQTAIAIRGPEPELTRYSHADIPARVKAVVGERDAQAAEIAALRQRWISVVDRLPETEEPVLIFMPSYPSCPIAIDCWRMQHESPVGWSSATVETGMGWDDHEFEEISHWMPLPDAPCAALSQEPK